MEVMREPIRLQGNAKSNRAPTKRAANGRMSKQARKVTQEVQEMGLTARDIAQEKIEYLRERASDYKDQGRAEIKKLERTMEQYIRERPLKTILIAAGIGLLVGRFWMRR